MSNYFTNIGRAITSLGAVIFVMLMVVCAMVFFSHTLFTQALPTSMAAWEKMASAWFMAFGWELTVLVTTCNVRHLNDRIPALMAVCSGIILLYFVEAFDWQQTALIITQRWFVSILIASVNYIYADLFYKKWMEFNQSNELPLKLNELQSEVNELRSRLNESESSVVEFRSLKAFKAKIEKELTCEHCQTPFQRFGSLHAHKGHCPKNPKNILN
ncbi:MAG: hypothetical protein HOP30_14700 [Cyclobacteriaceae bacterium]|nr:hypothetical protein [Cyclobacteriaceae bacterium]